MRVKMGLDEPMLTQYINYLVGILHGNFGYSYSYSGPVMPIILSRLPSTLSITLTGLVLALLVGVPIGVVSAVKQNTIFDYVFMVLALVGVSMPIFWLGLMLVLTFSVNLSWLPAMGMGAMSKGVWDVISHMILPCFCLATIPAATFARITRSSMLETINGEYIKALRARGIKESIDTIRGSELTNEEANRLFEFTQWVSMMGEFAAKGPSSVVLPGDFSQSRSMFDQMMAAKSAPAPQRDEAVGQDWTEEA